MAYYVLLTSIGLQRLANAHATGTPLLFAEVALGDSAGTHYEPDPDQTELVNEVWRGPVNTVDLDPDHANRLRIETIVPPGDGPFTVREAGLYDDEGYLIAVAKYPATDKPVPAEGVTAQLYVRLLLQVDRAEDVALTVDAGVVMATRLYVDEEAVGAKLYLDANFS